MTLQIGLEARALNKSPRALELEVSLTWLSNALKKNQGACIFYVWWVRLKKVC
jgi:hypothetical protein